MSYLLASDQRDALRRHAPVAVGGFSIFVDMECRLLTCGHGFHGELLGHAVDPTFVRKIGPPTLVPSMQGTRIVSVATGNDHSLALSAEGEVYSWGNGEHGGLGHPDDLDRVAPSKIQTLSRFECIAAGANWTSAAIDESGHLFTWGSTFMIDYDYDSDDPDDPHDSQPSGLGYEVDEEEVQQTPRRVDAFSQHRVGGRRLRSRLHPGGDRRRRGLFFWLRSRGAARPLLVRKRGAAEADRSPRANGAAVRRRGRR